MFLSAFGASKPLIPPAPNYAGVNFRTGSYSGPIDNLYGVQEKRNVYCAGNFATLYASSNSPYQTKLAMSFNGAAWTATNLPSYGGDNSTQELWTDKTQFLAYQGNAGGRLIKSSNGTTWTFAGFPNLSLLGSSARFWLYSNGIYLCVCIDHASHIIYSCYSTDLSNWANFQQSIDASILYITAASSSNASGFTVLTADGSILRSYDGLSWTQETQSSYLQNSVCIVEKDGIQFFPSISGGSILYNNGVYTEKPAITFGSSETPDIGHYINGVYAVGSLAGSIITSTDLTNWTIKISSVSSTNNVKFFGSDGNTELLMLVSNFDGTNLRNVYSP